mmetsp:Transcript_18147/g.47186  ORF Transcript_18147/g.47186 Transcript_18147/m.47186 type:complete len:222 (+) Transcript_18147:761-1426(+)
MVPQNAAWAMPLNSMALQEHCGPTVVRLGSLEGREGGVVAEDGGGLADRGLLLGPELLPLIVLLFFLRATVQEPGEEVLRVSLRHRGIPELPLESTQAFIVATEDALLAVVHLGHGRVLGQGGRHERLMRLLGLAPLRTSLLQVRLECVTHVLEDADDLAGACGVCAGERVLYEGRHHLDPLLGHESRCSHECLLDGRSQFREACAFTPGHELRVVRASFN